MKRLIFLILVMVNFLAITRIQAAEIVEVVGNVAGFFDLSADGRFVAGDFGEIFQPREAFIWSRETGLRTLGTLPGFSESRSYDISADGSVVVGYSHTGGGVNERGEAFVWTEASGMVGLGLLPGFNGSSSARAVSDDGSTIAGSGTDHPTEGYYPNSLFRWTAHGGMEALGRPGNSDNATVTDISADGSSIVGFSQFGRSFPYRFGPFIWTKANGFQDLGPQPPGWDALPTGFSSLITPDGSTIVGARTDKINTDVFRWTREDGMQALPLVGVPEGMTPDASVIVGYDTNSAFVNSAFVWDEQHGKRNLRQVLVTEHGFSDPELPVLSQAHGISNDGMTILAATVTRNPDFAQQYWAIYLDKPLVSFGTPGDYNGNGLVEQADLDLVLTNWGKDGAPPPNWTNDLPDGIIDQEELDGVLLNWGNTSPISAGATVAVPEPSSAVLVLIGLAAVAAARPRRRGSAD